MPRSMTRTETSSFVFGYGHENENGGSPGICMSQITSTINTSIHADGSIRRAGSVKNKHTDLLTPACTRSFADKYVYSISIMESLLLHLNMQTHIRQRVETIVRQQYLKAQARIRCQVKPCCIEQ